MCLSIKNESGKIILNVQFKMNANNIQMSGDLIHFQKCIDAVSAANLLIEPSIKHHVTISLDIKGCNGKIDFSSCTSTAISCQNEYQVPNRIPSGR